MSECIDYEKLAELTSSLAALEREGLLSADRERQLLEQILTELHVTREQSIGTLQTLKVKHVDDDSESSSIEHAKNTLRYRAKILFAFVSQRPNRYCTTDELYEALVKGGDTGQEFNMRNAVSSSMSEINGKMSKFGSVSKQNIVSGRSRVQYAWNPHTTERDEAPASINDAV